MKKWIAILPAGLALAACSSIDTAALVYVSTVKVGVHAAGGTAETPGANIMIGVDVTDAAFVPVAYGRRCPGDSSGSMEDCAGFPIFPLLGSSDPKSLNNEGRFRDANARVREIGELIVGLDESIFNTTNEITQFDNQLGRYDTAVRYLSTNPFTPAGASSSPPTDYTNAISTRDSIDVTAVRNNKNAAQQRLNGYKSQKAQLEQERLAFSNSLSQAYRTEALGESIRTDALSVYGSFSGDMGGKTGTETSATVALGKSFATGVAAQQLAEGTGAAAKAIGVAGCLKQVEKILADAPAAEKDGMRRALVSACGCG